MAVTAKDLKEYLNLPPDAYTLTGDANIVIDIFAAAVKKSGTYVFVKEDSGWALNGSAVTLSEYGITVGDEETEVTVEYEMENVDRYLSAAQSKVRAAGVPTLTNNAQYDLLILALAAMYYDNRGMVYSNTYQGATEENARRMINSFVLELRHGDNDG